MEILIRELEIYLEEYVDKIDCKVLSPDIKDMKIDKLISFNYTDSYRKYYDKQNLCDYDFIHGKADVLHTLETNNLVLGINEYLPENKRNIDVKFIVFKKFYQRILKGTGNRYKNWLDVINQESIIFLNKIKDYEAELETNRKLNIGNETTLKNLMSLQRNLPMQNLYIFGHSLDITDKDILRDLILNDNVYTTIYYPDKDELGKKIANLVKVIGQDELIKRTGGSTKTIEFKQQQDMVEIDS